MIDFDKKIINSNKFRKPCIEFINTGKYCQFPKGTSEYYKFWEQEMNYCIDGYTAEDGEYITGYNYFYLNYCPIQRIVYEKSINKHGEEVIKKIRKAAFPDFYDYDYYFFQSVQEAEEQGKHLCVAKSRRKGYEQPYSELVLTPQGYVEMGKLKVGDLVMNPDGHSCKIVEINEQGEQEVFEVELQDGRKVRCGENHLWATLNATRGKLHIKTTKEYSKLKLIQGSKGKEFYPYKLPSVRPLDFERPPGKIDPYVLGVLLGDGYICGSQIIFSTDDEFIVEELKKRLPDYTIKATGEDFKYVILSKNKKIHKLGRELKALGVRVKAQDKFIPDEYKYAPIEYRMELLQGLMDTDGSCTNGSSSFVSTSERLIDDLIFVCRSLGIRCKKSNKIEGRKDVDFGNGHFSDTLPHWEVTITTEENIFKLPRKLENIRHNRKYNFNGIGLKSIKSLGYKEKQRCIIVDHDNSLYITRDFVPTHNSYKCGSMLCRNFFLIPSSKSYVYAANKQYLTEDGILTKAWDYMDFIDQHTAWGKKRQVANTQMRRRASMLVTDEFGNKVEVGYKSEIIGVSLKDNPDAVRGKAGKLILWEEAGSNNQLEAAWQIARPSVEQDGVAFGLMLMFGTGGDEGDNVAALRNAFYDPKAFNCLEFENIWDEGAQDKPCGFFVPQHTNLDIRDEDGNRLYMDKDGNTLHEKAREFILKLREEELKSAKSSQQIDRYCAEHSETPAEAFTELSGNIFPKKELQKQLAKIRTNKKLANAKQVGDFTMVDGLPVWNIKKQGDITEYPLPKKADPTGAIVIWEHPVKDAPFGLYIIGCLTPGEKVITNRGLVNVEDVDFSYKLLNRNGEFVNITNLQRYKKVNEPIYKIRTSHTYTTTSFTKEHPILVSDQHTDPNGVINPSKFDFRFVKASELQEGQWTVVPNQYLRENDSPLYTLWDNNCRIDRRIDNPLIDAEFWWFVGLWLGDGYCVGKHTVSIVFDINDIDYIERLKHFIDNVLHRRYYEKKRFGCVEISFCCTELNNWLTNHFGKYANGKYISEWVKYLSQKYKCALLQGYLDSDGCVYQSGKYFITDYVSINIKLLQDVQDILFSLGLISNISKLRNRTQHKICGKLSNVQAAYQLRMAYHDTVKFKELINRSDRKLDKVKLSDVRTRPKDGCFFSNDLKYIYFKIRNIEQSIYTGWVYNFECDTHTFACRHIMTHNCDPYDHDQSGTNSLGSCIVYKRFQDFESYHDVIVAEYTGRPKTAEEFYERVRRLAMYYNAKIMYENQNKGLFSYFKNKHSDWMLADQPDILKDIVSNTTVNRGKGCHMNKEIKLWGEGKIKEWLEEDRGNGQLGLNTILSEPLLEELIKYSDKVNADRVMAFLQIMIYREQLYNVQVKKKEDIEKKQILFNKPLFSRSGTNERDNNFDLNTTTFTFTN